MLEEKEYDRFCLTIHNNNNNIHKNFEYDKDMMAYS